VGGIKHHVDNPEMPHYEKFKACIMEFLIEECNLLFVLFTYSYGSILYLLSISILTLVFHLVFR
jgi:hypothetical protein